MRWVRLHAREVVNFSIAHDIREFEVPASNQLFNILTAARSDWALHLINGAALPHGGDYSRSRLTSGQQCFHVGQRRLN
jgi:hypothetical protein